MTTDTLIKILSHYPNHKVELEEDEGYCRINVIDKDGNAEAVVGDCCTWNARKGHQKELLALVDEDDW